MHWAARRRRLDPWKEQVQWAWKFARPYWWKVQDKTCVVQVELPFPDERRRDPHNYTSTMMKVIIDALVTKKKDGVVLWEGAWPDDTPEWVETLEPQLVKGDICTVRIIPK